MIKNYTIADIPEHMLTDWNDADMLPDKPGIYILEKYGLAYFENIFFNPAFYADTAQDNFKRGYRCRLKVRWRGLREGWEP